MREASSREGSSRPLDGVRVVEFAQIAAGPFCGMLLADFGADVLKIEPPSGDAMRQWPPHTGGFSENFASVNRGKRSLALDLKRPEHCEAARRMVLDADVVVENNRPGAMDRLGLGWHDFASLKPSLVYCSISAYGQTGPRASEGGFDLTVQAAAGVMSVTGAPGGEPVKCGVPIVDFASGLYAAYSIASVLARVRAGGPGGHIDVPMFGATLAIAALQTSQYFGTGIDPEPLGSAHPRNAPYQAYRSADGYIVVAAGNDRLWQGVCDALGRRDLANDERFATTARRAAHQEALKDELERHLTQRPTADWLAAFSRAGVPSAPINTYSSALADPQAAHLKLVRPMQLPNGEQTRTIGCPVWLDGAPVDVDTTPPRLDDAAAAAGEAAE